MRTKGITSNKTSTILSGEATNVYCHMGKTLSTKYNGQETCANLQLCICGSLEQGRNCNPIWQETKTAICRVQTFLVKHASALL